MNVVAGQRSAINDLEARLEAKRAQLRDMATMGAVITSIQEINAVLSVVMDMAIRLVDGEVGLIMLETDGVLKVEISWGVNEEFAKSLMYLDGMDLPSYCFKVRETITLNELDLKAEDGFVVQSLVCAPIQTSEKCHGVMVIVNKSDASLYGDEDREILQMLLNFVAVAIDNSNLIRARLDQQKVDQEMAIARQIQETILPQDIDSIDGVDIGVAYYPAHEVGGDFYDLIRVDDSRFVVVLGDVSNKGVPAALVMSAAAGIIKSIIKSDTEISVSKLEESLNDILANEIIKDREMFVTLFFCKFDLEARRLTYSNAGHMPGLFWDSGENSICELAEGGPIVGQFPGIPFKQGERKLHPGDRLFLFTDGLTEATDADDNLFGRERAEQVFSAETGLEPKEFCVRVKEWIDRFSEGAGEETHDDFTIMQVKVS
ncbi:MAG: SpoIIE family protein phosphatase [candidate division Zixibacteria bacterium]|nr:SpoIIE family protein phosphatase [candidate division Zixibacteria bacterium]